MSEGTGKSHRWWEKGVRGKLFGGGGCKGYYQDAGVSQS